MKFVKYNSETRTIESEEDAVFVDVIGSGRETGFYFVLNYFGKKIGFGTGLSCTDNQSEKLANGTYLWRLNIVGGEVKKWDRQTRSHITLANDYKFESEDEQKEILGIIADSLTCYCGTPHDEQSSPSRAEYTAELLIRIKRGELLK